MVEKIKLKNKRSKFKDKQGISAVVATVLLIFISIIAVVIIWGVIKPFVKEGLNKGSSCFEALEKVRIVEDPLYTCSIVQAPAIVTRVMVEVDDIKINGLAISLYSQGTSKVVKIKQGGYETSDTGITTVSMYPSGANLELPPKNGARTYSIIDMSGGALKEKVSIHPIINGKVCSEGDEAELEICTS